MEEPKKGVLDLLNVLEMKERQKSSCRQGNGVDLLKERLEALVVQRDQLKAKIRAKTSLQKRLNRVEKDGPHDEEEILDGTENSQLLLLMARHTQLKDLLNAHHLTGGYDLIETRKGVCLSLATSFEGIYLDTYNLEIDLAPLLKICRHNIPLSIPVESLAVQSNMQSDVKAFLDTLSQHLNAYAGRKQQLALVKELHETVQVMESNKLYTILVLLFSLPGDTSTAFLCTLDYADPTQCLPTRVIFESNEKSLPRSPQWEEKRTLFLGTPVHLALATMRKTGVIN